MKFLLAYRKTIGWSVFMLMLFLIPLPDIPRAAKIPHMDKMVHTGFFMVFTGLLLWDRFRYSGLKSIRLGFVLYALLFALFFAVSVELLQEKMNLGREGDIIDILYDFIGFLLGLLLMVLLSKVMLRSL